LEAGFSFDPRREDSSQEDSPVLPSASPGSGRNAGTVPLAFVVRKPGYFTNTVQLSLPAIKPDGTEPALQLKIAPAAMLIRHVYPEAADVRGGVFVQLRRKHVFRILKRWFCWGSSVSGGWKTAARALKSPPDPPVSPPLGRKTRRTALRLRRRQRIS
jgi:hypothetical protein